MGQAGMVGTVKASGRKGTTRRAGNLRRSVARLAAVQALYQLELGGAGAEAVIAEFLDHRLAEELDGLSLGPTDRRLFEALVRAIAKERRELDDILAAVLAEDWPVERLETLVRIVLRAGAYELAHRTDIPARVVIKEYVDLADAFFGGKEPGLINGVLDRLAHDLRPEEFEAGALGRGLD